MSSIYFFADAKPVLTWCLPFWSVEKRASKTRCGTSKLRRVRTAIAWEMTSQQPFTSKVPITSARFICLSTSHTTSFVSQVFIHFCCYLLPCWSAPSSLEAYACLRDLLPIILLLIWHSRLIIWISRIVATLSSLNFFKITKTVLNCRVSSEIQAKRGTILSKVSTKLSIWSWLAAL